MSNARPAYMPKQVYCPPGVWTQVIGTPIPSGWDFEIVNQDAVVNIMWQRFSDLPPWYTNGYWDWPVGGTFLAITAGLYCGFDFKPTGAVGILVRNRSL